MQKSLSYIIESYCRPLTCARLIEGTSEAENVQKKIFFQQFDRVTIILRNKPWNVQQILFTEI
jgi:hypothetical protein